MKLSKKRTINLKTDELVDGYTYYYVTSDQLCLSEYVYRPFLIEQVHHCILKK